MGNKIRQSEVNRVTKETSIKLKLEINEGVSEISSSCPFFDHMLDLFAKHGGFTITLAAKGDIDIDYHHTVEDIGIALGKAFYDAAGDKSGIDRYGFFILPMDETLIESAVDFGGRYYFVYDARFPKSDINGFDLELVEEFWRAFAVNAKINLHIIMRAGSNSHHISEGIFKSVARSLKAALKISGNGVMSTKGLLE